MFEPLNLLNLQPYTIKFEKTTVSGGQNVLSDVEQAYFFNYSRIPHATGWTVG